MITTRKPARISKEKAHELLGKSFAEGLDARPDPRHPGTWLVRSCTQPGTWWRVTAYGCPCPGYARHDYCKHWVRAYWEERQRRNPPASAA